MQGNELLGELLLDTHAVQDVHQFDVHAVIENYSVVAGPAERRGRYWFASLRRLLRIEHRLSSEIEPQCQALRSRIDRLELMVVKTRSIDRCHRLLNEVYGLEYDLERLTALRDHLKRHRAQALETLKWSSRSPVSA